MRRVDRDRRQHRQPFGFEGSFEVLELAVGQLAALDDVDVTLLQRVAQAVPDFELPQLQVACATVRFCSVEKFVATADSV